MRILFRWLVMLVILFGMAMAVFVLTFDANHYRNLIQTTASNVLGRELVIDGRIRAGLSLRPLVIIEGVGVKNPDWASRPYLAFARRIEIRLELLPLLSRQFKVADARVSGLDLLLERTDDGRVNWVLEGLRGGGGPPGSQIMDVVLEESTVDIRMGGREWNLSLNTGSFDWPAGGRMALAVGGVFQGMDFSAILSGLPHDTWTHQVRLNAPGMELRGNGTIELQPPRSLDADIELQADSLSDLPIAIDLPTSGALNVSGGLLLSGGMLKLSGLAGQIAAPSGGQDLLIRDGEVTRSIDRQVSIQSTMVWRGVDLDFAAQSERDAEGPFAGRIATGDGWFGVSEVTRHGPGMVAGRAVLSLPEIAPWGRLLGAGIKELPAVDGTANWAWQDQELQLSEVLLRVGEVAAEVAAQVGLGDSLRVDATADVGGLSSNLRARSPSADGPWTGNLQLGDTKMQWQDLQVGASGRGALQVQLVDFAALAEVLVPNRKDMAISDLDLQGNLEWGSGWVRLGGFSLSTLGIDARGEVRVDHSGQRPRVRGQVQIPRIEFAPEADPESDRWNRPVDLQALSGWDADLQLAIQQISAPMEISNLSGHAVLNDSTLQLDGLQASIEGIPIEGDVRIENLAGIPRFQSYLHATDFHYQQARIDRVEVDARGAGASLSELIQNSEGTATLRNARLPMESEGGKSDRELRIDNLQVELAAGEAVQWEAVGLLDEMPFELQMSGGRLLELAIEDDPWPTFELRFVLGAESPVEVHGTIGTLSNLIGRSDIRVNVQVDGLSAPLALQGTVGTTPGLVADLTTPRLDLGFWFAETEPMADPHDLDLAELIRDLPDAQGFLQAETIRIFGRDLQFNRFEFHNEDGKGHFDFSLQSGRLRGNQTWDLNGGDPRFQVEWDAHNLRVGVGRSAVGERGVPFDAEVSLEAHGSSMRQLRETMEGLVLMHVGEGFLFRPKIPMGGRILFEILTLVNPFTGTESTTELSCGAVVLEIKDGVARADRSIAIQTPQTNFIGDGSFDLETTKVNMAFRIAQRRGLGLSLTGIANRFIKVGGTVRNPKVQVAKREAIKSGTIAAATGGLSILAGDIFSRAKAVDDVCLAVIQDHEVFQRLHPDDLWIFEPDVE